MSIGRGEQYLWSVHKLFPDVSCPTSSTCNFSDVTGTGTRSIPGVLSYVITAPVNIVKWAASG